MRDAAIPGTSEQKRREIDAERLEAEESFNRAAIELKLMAPKEVRKAANKFQDGYDKRIVYYSELVILVRKMEEDEIDSPAGVIHQPTVTLPSIEAAVTRMDETRDSTSEVPLSKDVPSIRELGDLFSDVVIHMREDLQVL